MIPFELVSTYFASKQRYSLACSDFPQKYSDFPQICRSNDFTGVESDDTRQAVVIPGGGPTGLTRPVLLNLGEPGGFDITLWSDRVKSIDATYSGRWELPVIGMVPAPAAVLIRPDGYVVWVGNLTQPGLADALTTWFGSPTASF